MTLITMRSCTPAKVDETKENGKKGFDFLDTLTKHSRYCNQFGNLLAEFFTIPHDLHRARRDSINPYFSKQKIMSLEPVIQANANKLCNRIREFKGIKEPFPIRLAYECLTTDIITEYCMAKSYGNLDKPDFMKYHYMVTKFGAVVYLTKQLAFLQRLIASLSSWLVLKLDLGMGSYIAFQEVRLQPLRPYLEWYVNTK
jgi:hypothetical protein